MELGRHVEDIYRPQQLACKQVVFHAEDAGPKEH